MTSPRQGITALDVTAGSCRDAAADDVAGVRRAHDRLRASVWPALRAVARPHPLLGFDFDNFIADFDGSEVCARLVRELPAYRTAATVFVTPDESTELIRRNVLEDGKVLVVSSFGITSGFRRVRAADLPDGGPRQAATMDWLHSRAERVTLADLAGADISLLITGSGAVADGGVRLGKGHGYFDLEWALFSEARALATEPQVVGVVHDCQRLPLTVAAAPHDVPLDVVVTPSGVEPVTVSRTPGRVRWSFLPLEKASAIPPVVELALTRLAVASP
jgi:5-formyltetrahydrofolate cyclo-ligase